MQRLARPALLTLLAALLLPGLADAQSAGQATAQTTVTVRIPTVLRLDVSTTPTARDQVTFAIDGTTVTPESVTVRVLANTTWQLSVKDVSPRNAGAPLLAYSVASGNAWRSFTTLQPGIPSKALTEQPPTRGWRDVPMRFKVDDPATAPAGRTTRTLLFTLTRP